VFEIPGVELNGVGVQIDDGNLVVCGERKPPYNITNSLQAAGPHTPIDSASGSASPAEISQNDNQLPRFSVKELYFGDFYRSIPLPVGIKVIIRLLTRPLFPFAIVYE
jgi:HSP20 family molecular chaperone IbpA